MQCFVLPENISITALISAERATAETPDSSQNHKSLFIWDAEQ
jgi:hypothetical protein